MVMLH